MKYLMPGAVCAVLALAACDDGPEDMVQQQSPQVAYEGGPAAPADTAPPAPAARPFGADAEPAAQPAGEPAGDQLDVQRVGERG